MQFQEQNEESVQGLVNSELKEHYTMADKS